MEKAYDLKALAEIAKTKGLDLAEAGAKIAFESVVEWLEQSAKLSQNPYDDMAMAVAMPKIKEEVLKLIDKIDGQCDNCTPKAE